MEVPSNSEDNFDEVPATILVGDGILLPLNTTLSAPCNPCPLVGPLGEVPGVFTATDEYGNSQLLVDPAVVQPPKVPVVDITSGSDPFMGDTSIALGGTEDVYSSTDGLDSVDSDRPTKARNNVDKDKVSKTCLSRIPAYLK